MSPDTDTEPGLLTRLATLCDPANAHSVTRAPFAVELGGRPWTGSTNGHVLMLVDAASTADAPNLNRSGQRAKFDTILTGLISDWPATGHIMRAALRVWVGGVDDPKDCPGCLGKPPVCRECGGAGTEWVTCDDCDHEHHHDCPDCDGEGTEACAHGLQAPSYGAVTDGTHTLTIDRAVLAPLLALMTGEAIDMQLSAPEDPLRFRGEGWRAALMPVRLDAVVPDGLTLTLGPVA